MTSKSKIFEGANEETSWRRAVENHAFPERILSLLTTLGANLEVVIRVTPATPYLNFRPTAKVSTTVGGKQLRDDVQRKVHPAQQRLDSYFREELAATKGSTRYFFLAVKE